MSLLNYTTSVPVSKTIGLVHARLVEAGARQIMTEYSSVGGPIGVSFSIETADGLRLFTLPVQVDRVLRVLERDRDRARSHTAAPTLEQAERVGWRIVKDWLEAQLAIIQTEMVTFDQVMLPYMRSIDGKTVYELYIGGDLIRPALPVGS
jgi:hypothetical protein